MHLGKLSIDDLKVGNCFRELKAHHEYSYPMVSTEDIFSQTIAIVGRITHKQNLSDINFPPCTLIFWAIIPVFFICSSKQSTEL